MSYITRQLSTSFVVFLLAALALAMHSSASGLSSGTSVKLSVTPAIVDLPLSEDTGKSTSKLRLQNLSDSSVPISFSTFSAVVDGEPLNGGSDVNYDVSSWIEFEKDVVLFEPGEVKKITFTVDVPEGTKPGGHYASINIRGLRLERSGEGRQTTVIFPEISVPVLITVPGAAAKDIRITKSDIFPLQVTPGGQVESAFYIENHGSTHELVNPDMVIRKSRQEVQRLSVEPAVVLPGTRKEFKASWEFHDGYGVYQAVVELANEHGTVTQGSKEAVYSSWSIIRIVGAGVVTTTLLHLLRRRKNVISAALVLLSKQHALKVKK